MKAARTYPNEHVVSEGRVHCQKLRRDVSVETCWMCDRLLGFDVDDTTEIVRCAPDRRLTDLVALLP